MFRKCVDRRWNRLTSDVRRPSQFSWRRESRYGFLFPLSHEYGRRRRGHLSFNDISHDRSEGRCTRWFFRSSHSWFGLGKRFFVVIFQVVESESYSFHLLIPSWSVSFLFFLCWMSVSFTGMRHRLWNQLLFFVVEVRGSALNIGIYRRDTYVKKPCLQISGVWQSRHQSNFVAHGQQRSTACILSRYLLGSR